MLLLRFPATKHVYVSHVQAFGLLLEKALHDKTIMPNPGFQSGAGAVQSFLKCHWFSAKKLPPIYALGLCSSHWVFALAHPSEVPQVCLAAMALNVIYNLVVRHIVAGMCLLAPWAIDDHLIVLSKWNVDSGAIAAALHMWDVHHLRRVFITDLTSDGCMAEIFNQAKDASGGSCNPTTMQHSGGSQSAEEGEGGGCSGTRDTGNCNIGGPSSCGEDGQGDKHGNHGTQNGGGGGPNFNGGTGGEEIGGGSSGQGQGSGGGDGGGGGGGDDDPGHPPMGQCWRCKYVNILQDVQMPPSHTPPTVQMCLPCIVAISQGQVLQLFPEGTQVRVGNNCVAWFLFCETLWPLLTMVIT